jgi:hypothetical protein
MRSIVPVIRSRAGARDKAWHSAQANAECRRDADAHQWTMCAVAHSIGSAFVTCTRTMNHSARGGIILTSDDGTLPWIGLPHGWRA